MLDNTQDVIKIITSDLTQEQKLAELSQKLNRELIRGPYIFERTLFHYLATNNLLLIFSELIERGFADIALLTDRNQQTILHYLCKKEASHTSFMARVIALFPQLKSCKDKDNNTPLDIANAAQKQWALELLTEVPLSSPNTDKESRTDITLDLTSVAFKQVFPDMDLTKKYFSRDSGRKTSERYENFFTQFNTEESRSSEPQQANNFIASDSSESSSRTTSYALNNDYHSILTGELSDLIDYLVLGGDPDVTTIAGRTLLLNAFILAKNALKTGDIPKSEDYQDKLNQLLLYANINITDKSSRTLLNYADNSHTARQIFENSLEFLAPRLKFLKRELHQALTNHSANIEKILFDNGLRFHSNLVQQTINFSDVCPDKPKDCKTVWELCTLYDDQSKLRIFDKRELCFRILGLQSIIAGDKILTLLRKLYKHFDLQQKLVAFFIVKELLLYALENDLQFHENLELFLIYSESLNDSFSATAKVINCELRQMHHEISEFKNSPLIDNFQKLTTWYETKENSTNLLCFKTLLTRAIRKQKPQRLNDALVIANELRALSALFYKNIHLREFDNGAWSREDKKQSAPTIVLHTHYFNQLVHLFVDTILRQKPALISNAIMLLAEVAMELSNSSQHNGPDLSSLMAISACFNNANISRLTQTINNLPNDYQTILMELNQMMNTKNHQQLREIDLGFENSTQFLGLYLTDLSFAIDGNAYNLLSCADISGNILAKILAAHSTFCYSVIKFKTTVLSSLSDLKLSSDDDHYHSSLRLQSRNSDFIDVSKFNSLSKLLKHYQAELLDKKLVPTFLIGSNDYPPQDAPKVFYLELLPRAKNKPVLIRRLEKLTLATIDVLRNHYHFTKCYNPVYVRAQFGSSTAYTQMKNNFHHAVKKSDDDSPRRRAVTFASSADLKALK